MTTSIRIALVGDCDPSIRAHAAIPMALHLVGDEASWTLQLAWLATHALTKAAAPKLLEPFQGIWCVPGSPYRSMEGALRAIQFARENGRPFLGTCGGFQHAIIESFRNVAGLKTADHAESNPEAKMPVIARLACSLENRGGVIRLQAGTRIAAAYRRHEITESFNCNFGFDARYEQHLVRSGLKVSGRDPSGEARVVELPGHPFFIATLFQPERSAFTARSHTLIKAFVEAARHVAIPEPTASVSALA
jgi:CTP synthase (UTP-ammonia lyase)